MLFIFAALPLVAAADPLFADQKALPLIHAEDAWAVTKGDASQRVGIVDTGLIRDHEDIADKDAEGFDFMSNTTFPSHDGDGRDADYTDDAVVIGNPSPATDLSHGTHVAGIIGAAGDNGRGIAGLNWRTQLVSARAMTAQEGGDSIDAFAAAKWLAGIHVDGVPDIREPVQVINMSLGFPGACGALQSDVDAILDTGVILVAAAGNHGGVFGGDDASTNAPANCEGVISVGATDFDLKKTDYTNDDGRIDIYAPGGTQSDAVVSLGAHPSGDGAYVGQFGTSMATPHVTGVVSLMLAANPALTPGEVKLILAALPSTCSDCNGAPMLDAAIAVDYAKNGIPPGTGLGPTDGGCSATKTAPSSSAVSFAAFAVLLALRRRRVTRSWRSR